MSLKLEDLDSECADNASNTSNALQLHLYSANTAQHYICLLLNILGQRAVQQPLDADERNEVRLAAWVALRGVQENDWLYDGTVVISLKKWTPMWTLMRTMTLLWLVVPAMPVVPAWHVNGVPDNPR